MGNDSDVVIQPWHDPTREDFLDEMVGELRLVKEAFSALRAQAQDAGTSESERTIRDAGRLIRLAMLEWRELCKERNKERGIVYDFAFNLQRAEREIESRMAGLVARERAEGVSGEPCARDTSGPAVDLQLLGPSAPIAAAGDIESV